MFKAAVKITGSVTSGTTVKGVPYKKATADVTTSRGTRSHTVMAFGKSLETVNSAFRKGRNLNLMVDIQRGTVKVIGYPRQAAPAADAAAA